MEREKDIEDRKGREKWGRSGTGKKVEKGEWEYKLEKWTGSTFSWSRDASWSTHPDSATRLTLYTFTSVLVQNNPRLSGLVG